MDERPKVLYYKQIRPPSIVVRQTLCATFGKLPLYTILWLLEMRTYAQYKAMRLRRDTLVTIE